MNNNVVSLRAGPPDPLAELFAERERLGQELQRFGVVDERRAGADRKIAEIDAALVALDRADRQAVERWAESAEGEPPAPLLDERKALLSRRLDAEAGRQAAEIAVAAVAGKRVALIHEMNRIGARIKERQIAAALDEGRRVYAQAQEIAADIGAKMMRLEGLRQALTDGLAEASGRRDDAQGATFRAALGEVETLRLPSVTGDAATVAKCKAEWKEAMR